MITRLLLILLIGLAVYWMISGGWRRVGPALARDPRWRYLLAGLGVAALRQAVPSLGRWLAALRFFR